MMTAAISLRVRLLLAFGTVLLLALGAPALYLRQHLGQTLELEAREQAQRDLQAIELMLVSESAVTVRDIDAVLRELASRMAVRITYMDGQGRLLIDSGVSFDHVPLMDNHRGRPEVAAALEGKVGVSLRYSDSLNQNLLYLAVASAGHGELPAGVLRLARPQSQISRTVDRLYGRTGWVFAASLLVGFVLISLASRQVSRGIASMAAVAAGIGQGEPGKRIRVSPSAELVPLVHAFNNMLERIETNVRTITKQKVESEAILNGMRAGVIVLDGRGAILRGNYAAQEIFPSLPTFAGRKPLEMTLLQNLQDACDQALEKCQAHDFTQSVLEVILPGGLIFDVSIVPVKGDVELGVIMVFHDITETRRTEQIRRDFAANVSHELRTPLTSIKGYAETLLGLEPQEQSRAFLEVILRNANHMNSMLDDVLQLSRLEHGSQRVDFVTLDPSAALYSAWKNCQPLTKQVQFLNEVAASGPAVRANFEQLVQVFRNVLENALKYVPDGTGLIRVHAHQDGENLAVSIEDNGPGIPAADQDRIFERFYRVEKDRNSSVGGTGLGLAICRHIVMNHHGRIAVQSPVPETGTGSRFIITLPLAGQTAKE